MRTKWLVTFKMDKSKAASCGEKRKREGKESVEESSFWSKSKCSKANLEKLVKLGLLHPWEKIQWRPAGADSAPCEYREDSIWGP